MKFRCSGQFLRAFERLDARDQAAALTAMQGFEQSPLIPSHLARRIDATPEVWAIPFAREHRTRGWITYQISSTVDDSLCVLRHVGCV